MSLLLLKPFAQYLQPFLYSLLLLGTKTVMTLGQS